MSRMSLFQEQTLLAVLDHKCHSYLNVYQEFGDFFIDFVPNKTTLSECWLNRFQTQLRLLAIKATDFRLTFQSKTT